jgi:MFS family permease
MGARTRTTLSSPDEVPPRVRRDTRLLVISGFFMSASQSLSSIAVPVALIHAGSGIRGVGSAMALMSLLAVMQTVLVGAYADRGFLRVFLIAFPLTSVLGIVPFLSTPGSALILTLGTVFGGFGGGSGANSGGTGPYQPAEYGWIARNYPAQRRNRLISSFSARSIAGVVLASAIALEAEPLARLSGFGGSDADQARFLMVLVGALALVPTIGGLLVHEPPRLPKPTADIGASPPTLRQRVVGLLWPAKSRVLLSQLSFTNGLNGIATGTYGAFLTTWLIVHFHASPSVLGLVNLIISVTAIFGDLTCPYLARRFGLVRAVIYTRSIQSLLIIPIAFSPSLVCAEVLLVFRQLAQRLNQPLRDSYVLSQADPDEAARMSALSSVTGQGVQSISSQVAGQAIAALGFTGPFVAAALCQFASGLLFYRFFARRPPPEETQVPVTAAKPTSA